VNEDRGHLLLQSMANELIRNEVLLYCQIYSYVLQLPVRFYPGVSAIIRKDTHANHRASVSSVGIANLKLILPFRQTNQRHMPVLFQ
jgi:hypothetical protein